MGLPCCLEPVLGGCNTGKPLLPGTQLSHVDPCLGMHVQMKEKCRGTCWVKGYMRCKFSPSPAPGVYTKAASAVGTASARSRPRSSNSGRAAMVRPSDRESAVLATVGEVVLCVKQAAFGEALCISAGNFALSRSGSWLIASPCQCVANDQPWWTPSGQAWM